MGHPESWLCDRGSLVKEDLSAGVAEDPEGEAEGLGGRICAEAAVGDEGELGGERVGFEVGEGDLRRGGGFGGENGEDFRAGVDAAGGAEFSEVFGEEEVESFGVLAGRWGEQLALEGFEVVGEERNGGGGDEDSLSLRREPRSQRRDLGHPDYRSRRMSSRVTPLCCAT